MALEVLGKKIMGKGTNLYMVSWYYVANFDVELIRAETPEEAIDKCFVAGNKDVTLVVTQLDPNNMPVVRKGKNTKSVVR